MASDSGGKLPSVVVPEQHRRPLLIQALAPRHRLLAAFHGDGAVVMLRRGAPTPHHGAAGKHAEGSSEGTSGLETALLLLLNSNEKRGGGFSKEACICCNDGSAAASATTTTLLLELLDQEEMPTGLLLHLTGPVEQIQIQGAHGITACGLLGTHYVDVAAADSNVVHGRSLLSLEIAPVNTRGRDRVPVKRPLGTSLDDLLPCLQEPNKADKTRGVGEVDYRNATEGSMVLLLLLVADSKTSAPESAVVEGVSTKRSICNSVVDEALSTEDASSRDPSERREALLWWIQLLNRFGVELEHELDWRSLLSPLDAAKVWDMNTTEMLLRGDADANEVNAIGSIAIYSRTQDPRTVWLQVKNDARIFEANTHGPIHMVALQNMRLDLNSASMIPWDSSSLQKNQATNKEGGDWLLDNELDDLNRCYIGTDVSAGILSSKFSAQVARIKSQPAPKQGSKFAPQMHDYMSKILVGCFQSSVDSEYHTEFLTAELGHVQPQGVVFIQSERKKVVANGKDHMVGNTVEVEDTVPRASLHAELLRDTSHGMLDGELCKEQNQWCLLPVQCLPSWFFIFRKWLPGFSVVAPEQLVDLPVLSQPKDELKELESDYQYPVSPLTTNGTGGSHDAENQQVEACSESNVERQEQCQINRLSNADSKQGGGSVDNNSLLIPIFVRHVSGQLTLRVNLGHSWRHLMNLYAQKTKTKLGCQYFVYRGKKVEPDCTLLFYGVERNTTVHVCGRLLGGVVTVEEYLINKKAMLLTEVTLPDGRVSLEMTKGGCLFLSTWLKCFTRAFADSKSWGGNFTLKDFKVTNGHVRVITEPNDRLMSDLMNADCVKLVSYIRTIFQRNKPNLVSKFPPYLEHLTTFLGKLKFPILTPYNRLFIETHLCCVESTARGILLVQLRKKFKSLDDSQQDTWNRAIGKDDNNPNGFASFGNLSNCAMFEDIIAHATVHRKKYFDTKPSTFRLMRDGFMHGPSIRFDKSHKTWREKFKNDDGIELMIPAHNPDLIPDIILSWIQSEDVDIQSELLAAQVRCTCSICHPSHSGSKGGGASSTAGKGKQAATASSGSSEPASPTRAAENPWSPQQHRRSFLDAVKSASASPALTLRSSSSSLRSSSSSRFSSPSSQDTKGKGKQPKR